MIRLPKRETKRLVAIHGWSGIVLGLILYAVVLTGMAAVFNAEIGVWSAGSLDTQSPFARPLDAGVRQAAARTPARYKQDVVLFDSPSRHLLAFFHRADPDPKGGLPIEHGIRYELDGHGRILDTRRGTAEEVFAPGRDDALGRFLVDTHVRLHLPNPWGLLLTGVCGLAMLVAAISGLLIHRHLFKDVFTLRRGARPMLTARDRHSVAATWSLPFAFALAFTGSYLSFAGTVGIPLLAKVAFAGDQAKMIDVLFGAPPAADPRPAAPGNLDRIVADAARRAGSAPGFVSMSNWGRADMSVVTQHAPPKGGLEPATLVYDGGSARFRYAKPLLGTRPSVGGGIVAVILPLHFGAFAGILSKAVWLGLGFAMCYVTLTGMRLWLRRREEDTPALSRLDRLVSVVGFGLPTALVMSAWGFFLGRAGGSPAWSTPVAFLAAAGAAIVAGMVVRSAAALSTGLRLVCGAGLLGLPILRLATGGPDWGECWAAGQLLILSVDLAIAIAGIAMLASVRLAWGTLRSPTADFTLQAAE